MSASQTAIVVVLLLPLIVLPLAAIASVLGHPEESWTTIGRSRTGWTIALFLFPAMVGFVAAVAYFALVRPKFPSVPQPASTIEPGTSVVVRSGPDSGRRATVLGRSLLFRPSGTLKIRFEHNGKRVHYPPQALQPADEDR